MSAFRGKADEFGLIVITDIASEVLAKDLSPDRVNVYEVMSKPVLTLPAEMNVVYAMRMLARFKLSQALVVDHERNPFGLVTLRDMVLRSLEGEEGA
ncbi:MAG: CBS domain-containing protein [Rhodospirillales bacterium]|nr:CBS domain-containing protein [Rhodospirillales bacterium]